MPVVLRAPHRVMFLAGAVQVLAALAWWSVELAGRSGLLPRFGWPVYPGGLHATWLIYGVYPFFIFGFLMTALPRWQGSAPVAPRVYLTAFGLCSGGWLLFFGGLAWPALLPAALALVLSGWIVGLKDLLRVANHPHPDRAHQRLMVATLFLGLLGLGLFFARVAGAGDGALRAALDIGLWWFLAPLFTIVSHRMIPFFTSAVIPKYKVYRPYAILYGLLACLFAHGALRLADAQRWLWLADLPAAALALHLSLRWRPRASLAAPLLAMLHLSFVWLWLALALLAVQSLALLAGHGMLGLAPLHGLTIGFFSSMLLGMASRVTLGHAGRDLAADRLTVSMYVGLHSVALLRMAADIVPSALSAILLQAAALGWILVFGTWFARYAPAYWRPRADGRPG